MNILKAYTTGFKAAVRFPGMVVLIYFVNIIPALLIALPFFGLLNESIGQSLSPIKMIRDFDFTVFFDFINNHESAVNALMAEIKWLTLFYLLISIFLNGGILRTLNKRKFTFSSFFAGSGYNFIRFLGLSGLMLALHIILILVVFVPLNGILSSLYDSGFTEDVLFRTAIGVSIFYALLSIILFAVADYAKFYMLLHDTFNIFKALWQGFRFSFRHFLKTYVLFLFLLLIPALFTYLYISIEDDIQMISPEHIFILFIIQQVVIFLRIWLRIWIFSSQFELYSAYYVKPDKIESEKQRIEGWEKKADDIDKAFENWQKE